jgi:hypothetical protein
MTGFILYTLTLAARQIARGRFDVAEMYLRQAQAALADAR